MEVLVKDKLSVSFVIILVLCNLFTFTYGAALHQFNCPFRDDKYKIYHLGNQPVFVVPPLPVVLENYTQLDTLLSIFEETMQTVVETTVENSVDELFDFYNVFVNSGSLIAENVTEDVFWTALLSYEPRYLEEASSYASILNTIDQLLQDNDPFMWHVASRFYIVTVNPFVTDDYIKRLNSSTRLPYGFFHSRTAGVVNIVVNHVLATIILDFQSGITAPIVFWHNQESTVKVTPTGIQLKFSGIPNTNGKYIVSEITNIEYGGPRKMLYYIQMSYCSFVRVTTKFRLLEPLRLLASGYANGLVKAAVRIQVNNAVGVHPVMTQLILGTYTENNSVDKEMMVDFGMIANLPNEAPEFQSLFIDIAMRFQYTLEDLAKKLNGYLYIFYGQNFLEHYSGLIGNPARLLRLLS